MKYYSKTATCGGIWLPVKKVIGTEQGRREPAYRSIHRAADSRIGEMIEAFLEAVTILRGSIVASQIKQALREGDFARVENLIEWNLFEVTYLTEVQRIFTNTIQQAGNESERLLPNELRTGIGFDIRNPRVEQFILERSGELIVQVTNETKLAVREELRRAELEGLGVDPTAQLIKQHVGLTRRQSLAVDNFRRRLIEEGVPLDEAIRISEAKAERALEFRGERIARTELIRAANQGASELMNQRVEENELNPQEFVKRYIITLDDRTCPICRPMRDQIKPLDQPFVSSVGLFDHPPIHVMCRCALSFEMIT